MNWKSQWLQTFSATVRWWWHLLDSADWRFTQNVESVKFYFTELSNKKLFIYIKGVVLGNVPRPWYLEFGRHAALSNDMHIFIILKTSVTQQFGWIFNQQNLWLSGIYRVFLILLHQICLLSSCSRKKNETVAVFGTD